MGILLLVPYVPDVTGVVGSLVTFRTPLVTADALIATLVEVTVVMRPY